jgi:peroxiredoxin
MDNFRIYSFRTGKTLLLVVFVAGMLALAFGQTKETVWSADERPLADQIRGLRSLSDHERAGTTENLALKIRQLPASENKLRLAVGLADRATEGDCGHDTLQEVTTTLTEALRERPLPWPEPKDTGSPSKEAASAGADAGTTQTAGTPLREPARPYVELASLVRYEDMEVPPDFTSNDEQFRAAMARLEADDRKREHPEFSLKDLTGKSWKFADLRGKVVLVNFWATWCPPCRKEMPDLEKLYERFRSKGLVILGISDEDATTVEPFIRERKVAFPVLLDPGRKVNEMFVVEGIPKSFVYNRHGKLVAQSIDMRTGKQFLEMLAKAEVGENQW